MIMNAKRADMAMMVQRNRKGHSRTQERKKEKMCFIMNKQCLGFYRLWCGG